VALGQCQSGEAKFQAVMCSGCVYAFQVVSRGWLTVMDTVMGFMGASFLELATEFTEWDQQQEACERTGSRQDNKKDCSRILEQSAGTVNWQVFTAEPNSDRTWRL
jgi:hypothetical protein